MGSPPVKTKAADRLLNTACAIPANIQKQPKAAGPRTLRKRRATSIQARGDFMKACKMTYSLQATRSTMQACKMTYSLQAKRRAQRRIRGRSKEG